MNCPSCAAPIPSHGVICTYCGQRIDVDLQGSGRSIAANDLESYLCPDCEIPLEPMFIESTNGTIEQSLNVNRCSNCLGLFVQRNVLDMILETKVRQPSEINYRLLTNLENSNRSLVKGWRYRPCPVCRTLMNRKLHGKRSGVIVDSCRDHGIWLDAGELRQLLEWSRAGGEKLNQERRALEQQQISERERRKHIEEIFQKNKLELDHDLEHSSLRQQTTTSILNLIVETIKDLLAY